MNTSLGIAILILPPADLNSKGIPPKLNDMYVPLSIISTGVIPNYLSQELALRCRIYLDWLCT